MYGKILVTADNTEANSDRHCGTVATAEGEVMYIPRVETKEDDVFWEGRPCRTVQGAKYAATHELRKHPEAATPTPVLFAAVFDEDGERVATRVFDSWMMLRKTSLRQM